MPQLAQRSETDHTVELWWDRGTDDLYVSLYEYDTGVIHQQRVLTNTLALDMFYHPYAYGLGSGTLAERISQYV